MVMVSAIYQYEPAIGIHAAPHPESFFHISPPPILLGCPRALALSALLHASNLHCLSILYMVIHMVGSMLVSQIITPSLSPTEYQSLFFVSVSPLQPCT